MKNYYEILGVTENADSQQIKKAYRELARQYHPDSTSAEQPDDERFIEATEAYRSLIDPFSRAKHDYALKQTWRVTGRSTQRAYLSTDNLKPFMWILATVLSFAAFMLCVFTALLIEYSPQKSTSRTNEEAERLQNAIPTSEAQDRATLNAVLSTSESDELVCTLDLVNHQTDCDSLPPITLFTQINDSPRLRLTLNPQVAIIESVRFDLEYADGDIRDDAWLLYFRDLRPNTSGDAIAVEVETDRLSAYQTVSGDIEEIGAQAISNLPDTFVLSDQQLVWTVNGEPYHIESSQLYQFPATTDEKTIDLWIGINRPLDDQSLDANRIGNIEHVTITIVVESVSSE